MKKLLAIGVALFVFASIGAAGAKSAPPLSPPVVAPAYSWTGFYVGLDGGSAWATQSVSDVACSTCNTFPASGAVKGSGLIGGVYAGYNLMLAPMWLVGIEGDWSWTCLNDATTAAQTNGGGVTAGSNSWSRNVNWLASLRGRLGFTPSPTTLLYVTGGAAWGGTDYSGQDIFVGGCPNCALTSFSQTKSGFVIGGGGEWAPWANNWLLKAEYLYYQLGGATSTVTLVGFPALPVTFGWGNLSVNELRIGVAYKF